MQLGRLMWLLAACGGSSSPPKPDAFPTADHTPYPTLPDQGGPKLTTPQLVTITFNNDARATVLESFAQWLVTSDWLTAVGGEYGITAGGVAGVAHRPEIPPAALTNAQVESYLAAGIADGSIPRPADLSQALFVTYYPMATTITTNPTPTVTKVSCKDFGAYHSEVHAMGLDFSYALIPDCGATMADLESAVSHEVIEASTDALPLTVPALQLVRDANDAWFTTLQFVVENADMCEAPVRMLTEAGYTVQRSWSNIAAAAGGDPCVPAGAAVGFGTSGPATVQTIAPGASADVPLVGWSSGTVDDWKLTAQTWFADGTTTSRAHLSLDQTMLNNGGTATAHVTVPASATSGQGAAFLIISQHTPTDQQMWPVSVLVQ